MLRGFLKVVVLKALGEGPKSGYALMRHVQDRMGVRPSPGSVYPLLDQLKKERLVGVKGVGRAKEYRLTAEGVQRLTIIEEKRSECLCSLIEGMKMLSAITGEDMSFPIAMVERARRGELPFKEINPEWDRVRDALFLLMRQGRLQEKAHKIRKILAAAYKRLRAA